MHVVTKCWDDGHMQLLAVVRERRLCARFYVLNVIDGELKNSNSGKRFSNYSPVDETYICEVAQSNAEDIDEASSSSKVAFKEWSKTNPSTRKKILHKIADKNGEVLHGR